MLENSSPGGISCFSFPELTAYSFLFSVFFLMFHRRDPCGKTQGKWGSPGEVWKGNYPYFQVTRPLIPDTPSFTPLRPALSERPHAGLRIKSSPIKLPLTGLSIDVDEQVSLWNVRIYTVLSPSINFSLTKLLYNCPRCGWGNSIRSNALLKVTAGF